jgi:hypothetical protein
MASWMGPSDGLGVVVKRKIFASNRNSNPNYVAGSKSFTNLATSALFNYVTLY